MGSIAFLKKQLSNILEFFFWRAPRKNKIMTTAQNSPALKKVKLVIPPKHLMTQTSWGDPIFYHYNPISGPVYRRRLKNTLKLIQPYRFEKLLEIGYGSGVFLPTLSRFAKEIVALDLHKEVPAVQRMLDWYQVSNVKLVSADIMKMPFEDNSFDGGVIVSTLEDIPDSGRAVSEIKRVLKPNARFFVSFPVKNFVTDTFFRLAGYDPEVIHPSDHRYILKFLSDNFKVEKVLKYPKALPMDVVLYASVSLINTK
jgi:SAM-dependent methyltransferase